MADETKLANPAVLGLTCFGLTTVLLNLHNAGLFKSIGGILALGIFVGGTVQIIAGVLEYKKGNTFGTTAFCAYGAFWLSLVFILLAETKTFNISFSTTELAWYLLLWGIFTGFMFIGTLKVNRVLQSIFAWLFVLFMLLAIHFAYFSAAGKTTAVLKTAGVVGIVTGGLAIYLAMAELINEMHGKTLLPIWPMGEKEAYKQPEDL
jgi:hypothetical protein